MGHQPDKTPHSEHQATLASFSVVVCKYFQHEWMLNKLHFGLALVSQQPSYIEKAFLEQVLLKIHDQYLSIQQLR